MDPFLRCDVVGKEESGQEQVVIMWCSKDDCGGRNVIDDDCGVLKGLDAECVTCACCGSICLDVTWPLEMSQQLKIYGVSAGCMG